MYALPAYGSVDPNPLMAPFFIFFYGMMMADMGYGLLMILGCAFIIKKKNLRGEKAQFFNLFKYCGFATFAFGLITGSFFGNLIPQLTEMLTGTAVNLPSLFSPLDDALAVLLGSLVLGLVQIFTGMAVNIYNKVRRGQVMDALCNEGAWYLVFILGGCAALTGKVKPFVIAIVVLLLLTQGYGKKGIVRQARGHRRVPVQQHHRLFHRHPVLFSSDGADAGRCGHCSGVQHPRLHHRQCRSVLPDLHDRQRPEHGAEPAGLLCP